SERPVVAQLASAALGIGGVVIMLAGADGAIHLGGVAASLGAMTMSSLGFVLAKRWNSGQQRANALTTSAWQLTAGGLLVLPLAALLEPFPSVTGRTLVGLAWVSGVATALAYVVWFQGLRRLTAGQVGLIGLLNPVAGVVTGTLLAAEVLTLRQAIGIALVLVGVVVGQRTAPAPRPAAGTAPRPTESGRARAPASDQLAAPGRAARTTRLQVDHVARDAVEGLLDGLPQRRVGEHDAGHLVGGEVPGLRDVDRGQQLGDVRADHVCAEDLVVLGVGDDLHEP